MNKEVTQNQEKEKDVHRAFQEIISENKFADYLTRIFKKKYKPPKTETGDGNKFQDFLKCIFSSLQCYKFYDFN